MRLFTKLTWPWCSRPGSKILFPVTFETLEQRLLTADEVHQVRRLLQGQPPPAAPAAGHHHFYVDSQFLFEAFSYVGGAAGPPGGSVLPHGFKEVYSHISGMQLGPDSFALCRLIPVRFERQSAGGVTVENHSNLDALSLMTELGQVFVAHVHSHPFVGPNGTRPSSIDLDYQQRLEQAHIAIGLIFARDAFVRFFSHKPHRFTVHVKGRGIKEIAPDVYQLDLAYRPFSVGAAATHRRGGCDR